MDLEQMCPKYQRVVDIVGKRWTALMLRALISGPRRFKEIKDYVPGLSDRLLSERLQELEEAGIVERRVLPQRPVLVEYALTAKGADLRQVVEALQTWADRWVAPADAQTPGPDASDARPDPSGARSA